MSTPEKNLRVSQRDRDIFECYIKHQTQATIAKKFGISQPVVSQAIKRVRESIPEETKEQQRERMASLMDRFVEELAVLAFSEPIPAYSNGRPIVIEDGEGDEPDTIAEDHTSRIKAMTETRAMLESKRKMFGLDAPVKAEVDATVKFEVVGIDTKDLQ